MVDFPAGSNITGAKAPAPGPHTAPIPPIPCLRNPNHLQLWEGPQRGRAAACQCQYGIQLCRSRHKSSALGFSESPGADMIQFRTGSTTVMMRVDAFVRQVMP